jgi:bacteriocin biosynthesis cyclodehydratase domain-containing protein
MAMVETPADWVHLPLRALPVQVIETSEGVVLRRGVAQLRVQGALAAELVDRVLLALSADGACAWDIALGFAAPDRDKVIAFVELLARRRFALPAVGPAWPDEPESPLDVFHWEMGSSTPLVLQALRDARLVVVGVNEVSRQLARMLLACGLGQFDVVDDPLFRNLRMFGADGAALDAEWAGLPVPVPLAEWESSGAPDAAGCVVATSDLGGLVLLRRWNQLCVRRGLAFFPVVLQDMIGQVGPLVIPNETACFECMLLRQSSNAELPDWHRAIESVAPQGQSVVGYHPAMAVVLGSVAALELAKAQLPGVFAHQPGTLVDVNLVTASMRARRVLKVPRCPVCGPANRSAPVNLHARADWAMLAGKP